ncbi:MAG TPA: A/G-specific adenine glycosylase [Candidatus Paceibacterota bacterium]
MTKEFQKIVYEHYRKCRRTFPWRHTRDPYRILVSEIMLQQTQVERVIPFYKKFLKKFPTPRSLAGARLPDVLKVWQGLGYNRRAKFLHESAKVIAKNGFPKEPVEIEQLPGVGHYSARAIAIFAFNKPEVCIETNIRTVFFHHFFKNHKKVSDAQIKRYIARTLDHENPRKWYSALMDYGAYLKQSGVRLNSKSKHYIKQSKFDGSHRQLRGRILKMALTEGKVDIKKLSKEMKKPPALLRAAADSLRREGLLHAE